MEPALHRLVARGATAPQDLTGPEPRSDRVSRSPTAPRAPGDGRFGRLDQFRSAVAWRSRL